MAKQCLKKAMPNIETAHQEREKTQEKLMLLKERVIYFSPPTVDLVATGARPEARSKWWLRQPERKD
jgi:hypothetical protein